MGGYSLTEYEKSILLLQKKVLASFLSLVHAKTKIKVEFEAL